MSTTDEPRARIQEGDVVVTEAILDAAPAKVWRALTRPEIVADWLGAAGFDARPGSRFAIPHEADRPAIGCEILAADPPHRLSYTWREHADGDRRGGHDGIVIFELSPAGPDRTHLRVVHRAVALVSDRRRPAARRTVPRFQRSGRPRASPMRLAA